MTIRTPLIFKPAIATGGALYRDNAIKTDRVLNLYDVAAPEIPLDRAAMRLDAGAWIKRIFVEVTFLDKLTPSLVIVEATHLTPARTIGDTGEHVAMTVSTEWRGRVEGRSVRLQLCASCFIDLVSGAYNSRGTIGADHTPVMMQAHVVALELGVAVVAPVTGAATCPVLGLGRSEIVARYHEFCAAHDFNRLHVVVSAGAACVLLGLREHTQDIDVSVSPDYFAALKATGACAIKTIGPDMELLIWQDVVEVHRDPKVVGALDELAIIDDVLLYSEQALLRQYHALNRPKDQDILRRLGARVNGLAA